MKRTDSMPTNKKQEKTNNTPGEIMLRPKESWGL